MNPKNRGDLAAYNATAWRGAHGRSRLTPKNLVLLVSLLALFIIPGLFALPPAKAVTTTNCVTNPPGVPNVPCTNSQGGNAVAWGMQRKVFYASGEWWIFWATGVGAEGMYYQWCAASSPTSCNTNGAWSTPASISLAGSANQAGQYLDLYQSGNTVFYVLAPNTGVQSFVWGAINLPAGRNLLPADYSVTDSAISFLSTGLFGFSQGRSSISVDGNGDLWIAFTAATTNGNGQPFYMLTYECTQNVLSTPANCAIQGNWNAAAVSASFKLADNTGNYISPPTLLPATVGVNNYMTMSYVNLANAGQGGPFDIFVSQAGSVAGGIIQWVANGGSAADPNPYQAPANAAGGIGTSYAAQDAGGGAYYSAISSGSTLYVVSQVSAATMVSFAFVVGTGFPAGTYYAIPADPFNVSPSLSLSGTVAVLTFYDGNIPAWVFHWNSLACISSGAVVAGACTGAGSGNGAGGWSGYTDLTLNTEFGVGYGDASAVSYSVGGYNLIGVVWNNNIGNPAPATNRIRFAVESMSNVGVVNFPVSVTLSYYEYTNIPSANYQVTPSNYFTITYSVCNEAGCSGPGVAQYTSSAGAPLTMNNVQSYSEWFVSAQTSASTNGEKWCLLWGGNCPAQSGFGASDGLTQSWYYYDQLAQPNLYAIATPALLSVWTTDLQSVATSNYDAATGNPVGFTLYPNLAGAQPWILPRADIYSTGGVDENVQYVRSRDVLPGCTLQTTTSGTAAYSGTTASATNLAATVAGNPFTAGQYINDYLRYTTGSAAGQEELISSNTVNTVTVSTAFNPVPTPTGGDAFVVAAATCSPATSSGTLTTVPVSVSTPTVAGLPAQVVEYVPIAVSNSQDAATPANFQQMISINSASFASLETTTLQNIEFFASGGAILPSWLESGNLNTATNSVYWVNLGTNTIAAASVGSTLSPAGLTTTVGTTSIVLHDAAAAWAVNQWVGDYLDYTSGPASGQFLSIVANTANTITVNVDFSPAPTEAGGDGFSIVTIVPSTLTIYMGFASTSTNLFTTPAGNVGEAPTLSPAYGQYDNGAVVFSAYWDFAGNSLPAGFTSNYFSGPLTSYVSPTSTDAVASWTVNQWVGDYLKFTNGPAIGESLIITANTATTITTAAFSPAPVAGNNFVITSGSGIIINNGVTFTGTQITLIESTAGTYSDTAITESNTQSPNQANPGGVMLVSSLFTFSGTTTAGDTKVLLDDVNANWVVNSLIGDILQYTSGPDNGLSQVITSNTANTISTAAFTNNPTAGGTDTFGIRIPGQGAQYTAPNYYNGGGNCPLAGNACNGFDIDVDGGNFRSLANGLTTNTPASVNPGISSYINGGTAQMVTYFSGTTTAATNFVATDGPASWTVNQFANDYLRYTTGPAAGQEELISSNTANTITVGVAFLPVPTAGGGDNFIVISGDTIQYVNELPVKTASYIAPNVPSPGNNFYIAAGATVGQVFSFNWIRQRAYPPNGMMPGAAIGPATIANPAPAASKVVAYAPITITNNQATITPAYFQADVNVTSNSPAYFSGTTSSTAGFPGLAGIAAGSTANTLTVGGSPWANGQWIAYSLEYVTGPAAGETIAISGNNGNTLTTASSFFPLPDGSGDQFIILPISILTDASATWAAGAYVGDYLQYTSGPAAGQRLQITANTPTTITTIAPKPAPNAAGGDTFAINSGFGKFEGSTLQNVEFFTCSGPCSTTATAIPSWLESGGSNTAPNSVYWINLPSSIAANGGQMTVYIGFASTNTNLLSAAGYTGETAIYGPSYGFYDNGAIVFNLYDNFAGTTLSPQWAPTSTYSATDQGVQLALGQLGLATDFQNEAGSTVYTNNLLNPSAAAFDSAGDLWVVDSGYNRVVEYQPPFTAGEAATLVVGQPSFATGVANNPAGAVIAATLSNPRSIAFDSAGDLWVADAGNNRILEYQLSASGTATGGSITTLVNAAATWTVNQWVGFTVTITSGTGSGEVGIVTANTANTLTVLTWTGAGTGPASGSGYSIGTPLNGMNAALVIGQTLFTSNGGATSQTGLSNPRAITFDSSGDLWVADTGNNRVLEYQLSASGTATGGSITTLVNAAAAWTANQWVGFTVTITSGTGSGETGVVTSNTANTLTVGSWSGAGTGPASGSGYSIGTPLNDMDAALVFGQAAYNTNGANTNAIGLNGPSGIAVNGVSPNFNLWVADSQNNRVVEYAAPLATGEKATLDLGQGAADFTGSAFAATGVLLTVAGAPWIVNQWTGYYLEYTSGAAIGQALVIASNTANTITTAAFAPAPAAGSNFQIVPYQIGTANQGLAYPTSTTLYTPLGMAFDGSGNLWVTDSGNNRVLEFAQPFTFGQAASLVLGQSSFTTSATSTSASGVNIPRAVVFDSAGNLWITDAANNRVVEIVKGGGFTNGEAATMVEGQPGFNLTPNPLNLYDPTSAAFDSAGNLWVVDSGNNRILEYASNGYQFITGQSASLVIGQPDYVSPGGALKPGLYTNAAGSSSAQLNDPTYIAFDSYGDLFVSDTGNNRVLEYIPGTSGCSTTPSVLCSGMGATVVIGQAGFGTSAAATTQAGLSSPHQLTFDSSGNLWVADTGNNRVLEYLTAAAPSPLVSPLLPPLFSTGQAAAIVLGQSLFTTGAANSSPAVSGLTTAGTTSVVLQDSNANWPVNQWVGSSLTYTATGQSLPIASNTANTITTTIAFSPAPGVGSAFTVGPSSTSLSGPYGVAFNSGDIWVSDTGNNRVLEYTPAFSNDEAASTVIGQTFLTQSVAGQVQTSLRQPTGIAFDYWGDLWVADTGNNRVLAYDPTYNSLFSGMPANVYEGQGEDNGATTVNGPGDNANNQGTVGNGVEDSPVSVTFDPQGQFWVADAGNNRIIAPWSGSLTIHNGVTVRQTGNWEGLISRATINPGTNVLEFYGYMSSTSSVNQIFGMNTPALATPTPTPNSLYDFSTQNHNLQNWFVEYNAAGVSYNYLGVIFTPGTAPQVTYVASEPTCSGIPNEYPATTVICGESVAMTEATTTYWAVKNSTMLMVNVIPGNPDQQWEANPNLLSWTLYTGYTAEPAIPYYLQYGNTFTVQGGGLVPNFGGAITFVLYGTQFGAQNTPINTFSASNPSKVLYVDSGTVVTFAEQGSGSAPGVRWENSNNQSQSVLIGTVSPNTEGSCTTLCTATYFEQYEQYLSYVTKDGSLLPATTVPMITFKSFTLTYNVVIPATTRTIWIDAQTNANITSIAPGSTPYEHWTVPVSLWTITCTNTGPGCASPLGIPNPIVYYHQFEQQVVNYKTSDYNPSTSPTTPQITYITNGVQTSTPLMFTGATESGTAIAGSTKNILDVLTTPVTAAVTGGTAQTLIDAGALWIPGQWSGYWLTYTSGPNSGDSLQILSNTANTITTAISFPNAPAAGNGFTVTTSWILNEWVGYTLIYTSGANNGLSEVITASSAGGTVTTAVAFPSAPAANDNFEILDLVWMDATTQASVTGTLSTAGGVERWVPDQGDGTTGIWTITGTNCAGVTCLNDNPQTGVYGSLGTPAIPGSNNGNASIIYDHQFLVSYETFPPASPDPPSSQNYPLGISSCAELTGNWCQSGAPYILQTPGYVPVNAWQTTPFMVEEQGNASMIGQGFFTGTQSAVCFEPSDSPPCAPGGTTVSAISLVILTPGGSSWEVYANFELQEGITFDQTGIPVGAAQWTVTVVCDTNPQCTGVQGTWNFGQVVKVGASSTTALLIANLPYATYNFIIAYPTVNAAGNIRWLSTPSFTTCTTTPASCSVTLNAANPSKSVLVTFTPQYLVLANSNPLWTSTIQITNVVNGTVPVGVACILGPPPSGPGCNEFSLQVWLLADSSATLVSSVTYPGLFSGLGLPGPAWQQWTGTGCAIGSPGCLTESSLSISIGLLNPAPVTETANYYVEMLPIVFPPAGSADTGGETSTAVEVLGGEGTGTVSVNPVLLPPGVTVDFQICDPGCGAPSANIITFPTSTEGPHGVVVTMTVQVAANSPAYGPYPITITSSYDWAPDNINGVCGTAGQFACPVFTLEIITPQAVTVGPSNAYGITTPGQTALTFANGNWLAFYFGQNSLVYSFSPDGITWSPGGVVPDGLIPATSPATMTTALTTPSVLHDASATWTPNEWVGYYLTYTSNGASGESELVLSNTATTITTAAFAPGTPTPGGGDSFAMSDGGVHGYSFAITSSGSNIYYVLSSANNNTVGTAKPGNYFYWNYGTVASNGIITWNPGGVTGGATDNAQQVSLCPLTALTCPLYGAGQPSILTSTYLGGNYVSIALPVLTKVGGQPLWLMQLWQDQLGLGGAPVVGGWSDGLTPTVLPSTVPGIPARTNGVNPYASSVNLKLLGLPNGVLALTDWVGNDQSTPSVEIFVPAVGFTQWTQSAPDPAASVFSCTPASSGVGNAPDYVLFGQQSDEVASGNLIYFAGQNGAPSSGLGMSAFSGEVVYFAFQYNPNGATCGLAGGPASSGFNAVFAVGAPTSPLQPWHVTLSVGASSLTLGFGEQDVLGSALGTCDSSGNCAWVVLPASVSNVIGLTEGLSSDYTNVLGDTGTLWVETSSTSPTGYITAFALI